MAKTKTKGRPKTKTRPKATKKVKSKKPKKVVPDGTFEKAVAWLNQEGVEFHQDNECVGEVGVDRHWEDRPTISGFKLPFTAEEWLDITDKEGEFLGMCCATISNARDILLSQLREGRSICCGDALEFVELLGSHDGFEWLRGDEEPEEKDHPFYKFWRIWQVIKPHANITRRGGPKIEPNKNPDYVHPIHEALGVAHGGLDALYYAVGCFGRGEDTDPEWMKQQRIAQRKLIIARTIPALRQVLEHIAHLDYGDFDGFAICNKQTPSFLTSNRLGHCIFQTRSEAEAMIDAWAKPQDHEKEPPGHREKIRENVVIRPVRVSTAKGIEFTDGGTDTPDLDPVGEDEEGDGEHEHE